MAIKFTAPKNGAKFPLGEIVEFAGTVDAAVKRVELTADDQFILPTVTLKGSKWFVGHRQIVSGQRKIVARGFNSSNKEITSASLSIKVDAPDFGALVPIPANINPGVTKARQQTMLDILGKPGALTEDCSPVTNAALKKLLLTGSAGQFTITGLRPAVEALKRIFVKLQAKEPELLKVLSSAGMLCCRRIRRPPGQPPSKQFSNHSWGSAIDLKVKGTLDPRGDGKTQLGLLILSPFFNEEGFFWGAGFSGSTEDAMHFEASDELVREWKKKGLLNL